MGTINFLFIRLTKFAFSFFFVRNFFAQSIMVENSTTSIETENIKKRGHTKSQGCWYCFMHCSFTNLVSKIPLSSATSPRWHAKEAWKHVANVIEHMISRDEEQLEDWICWRGAKTYFKAPQAKAQEPSQSCTPNSSTNLMMSTQIGSEKLRYGLEQIEQSSVPRGDWILEHTLYSYLWEYQMVCLGVQLCNLLSSAVLYLSCWEGVVNLGWTQVEWSGTICNELLIERGVHA